MKVKSIVRFIEICGRLTSTWPPDPNASIKETIFRELFWFASLLNVIGLLLPLVLGVYHYRNELDLVMKALCELVLVGDHFFDLVLCKMEQRRLQTLLLEVTNYVKNAKTSEIIVLQKYLDRYSPLLMIAGSSSIIGSVVCCCGPLIMTNILPAVTWYPFPIESLLTRCSLYVLQILAILQNGVCITVNFTVSIMLCYATAKLETLGTKIKIVYNETQLNWCIKEHQRLIAFVTETRFAVRFIILKCIVMEMIVVICGGFPLIRNERLFIILEFILIVVCGLMKLYVNAWPADDLAEMNEHIARSVYFSHWIDGTSHMRKSVLFAIQRSQKPLVISVRGILPALTLKYYAIFVSTTLSYCTTVYAVLRE